LLFDVGKYKKYLGKQVRMRLKKARTDMSYSAEYLLMGNYKGLVEELQAACRSITDAL
jgi:hypothetical protein